MISFNNLTMVLGHKLLFHEVDLIINGSGRYGVVGANGSGKTTLLKLLAKEMLPADGQIHVSKNLKIGWLNQDHFRFDEELIINVVLRGNKALWQALTTKQKLLKKHECDEQTANELSDLEEIIQHENGYQAENDAEKILTGLGISESYFYETLNTLSGGYKMRVLLAQTLFNNPGVLLLDEPTNHLDIMTTLWLEEYLIKNYKGILVLISHDRDFLNHLATHIIDIDYNDIRLYHGNYDKFCIKKAEIVVLKDKERASGIKKIEEMQKFVDRFRAKATKAKQAQSRIKMIEKIELQEKEVSSRMMPQINFKIARPSGKQVLVVKRLSKSFNGITLYKDISFTISRGEKIAIIGHNGVGKSTLIKQLLTKDKGENTDFTWGHEIKISYFSQDHHELLKESISVFNWLRNLPIATTDIELRKVLGNMLFTKDDVDKNILSLSGGEAARLLFAKIILEKSNMLIFDEPTNHMDLETIETLQKALNSYRGTLILVSHNRYFVSKIAQRIFAMTEDGVYDHRGSYDEFISIKGQDYLSGKWLQSVS